MSLLLPSYIQKGTDARKNLEATYGILLKSIPFKPFPELKDLPVRDWPDEQGDDEYIPANPVFKAYESTVEFIYKGEPNTARQMIYSFLQYIQGAEFNIFDTWKQVGYRCRYVAYEDTAYYNKEKNVVEFSVKMKVNNPLSYGLLVDVTEFVALAECDLTLYWADGTVASYNADETITRAVPSGNEFLIVVPKKTNLVEPIAWADSPTRLDSTGYTRILSYTGVRYVAV